MGEHDETKPPPIPDRDRLSHSEKDSQLTIMPIDWDLSAETISAMSPYEREEYALTQHEQIRRLKLAIEEVARQLAKVVPPEDGETLNVTVDKLLNPDKYPITREDPEVGPPE